MIIGPQVAFVDDVETEIIPLTRVLEEMHAGTVFFDATPDRNRFPDKPLETIKLLFLDLFYKREFDPYLSAQWVQRIIAPNTKYSLIIWSKDTHKKDELLEILGQIELMPAFLETWQKSEFDIPNHNFSSKINGLIENISQEPLIEQDILYGEVLEISDDIVTINCLLSNIQPTFQVRKFDKKLLSNISDIKIGTFVRIHIYSKPGTRLIDIFEEKNDKSDLFKQIDFFKNIEGNSFFIQG